MKKRIVCCWLAAAIVASLVGCAASGTEATDPSGTADPTAVIATDPSKAIQPKDTTPSQGTEPDKETEPANEGTRPGGGSGNQGGNSGSHANSGTPAAIQPKPTEPPHTHSYTTSTVAPTCTDKGYTLHKCSCGDSYKDGETAALGHSFGDWAVTVAATTEAEGEQERTCAICGTTETQAIEKLPAPAVSLDYSAAMAAGNSYGVSTYGWVYDSSIGWDDGYEFASSYSVEEIMEGGGQEFLNGRMRAGVDSTAWGKSGPYLFSCYCYESNGFVYFYVFYG